jgi:hypothetical protein
VKIFKRQGPAATRAAAQAGFSEHGDGSDPRDIAMATFGSEADREAYFDRRGLPDPLQQREAGQ